MWIIVFYNVVVVFFVFRYILDIPIKGRDKFFIQQRQYLDYRCFKVAAPIWSYFFSKMIIKKKTWFCCYRLVPKYYWWYIRCLLSRDQPKWMGLLDLGHNLHMAYPRDNPNPRINMRQQPIWTRVSQPSDHQQDISASIHCGYGT